MSRNIVECLRCKERFLKSRMLLHLVTDHGLERGYAQNIVNGNDPLIEPAERMKRDWAIHLQEQAIDNEFFRQEAKNKTGQSGGLKYYGYRTIEEKEAAERKVPLNCEPSRDDFDGGFKGDFTPGYGDIS